MEIKLHVKHDFTRMSPVAKGAFGSRVISRLSENISSFKNLPFSVAELTEANDTLQATIRLFGLQGKMAKGALIDAKREWLRRFRITATYIDALADGSGVLIASSGFSQTKKESAPSKKPDRVYITAMHGQQAKGAVRARVKALRDARGYLFGMATKDVKVRFHNDQIIFQAGDSLITLIVGSQRDVQFTGLPRLTSMQGIAAAFNRAGLGNVTTADDVSVP